MDKKPLTLVATTGSSLEGEHKDANTSEACRWDDYSGPMKLKQPDARHSTQEVCGGGGPARQRRRWSWYVVGRVGHTPDNSDV